MHLKFHSSQSTLRKPHQLYFYQLYFPCLRPYALHRECPNQLYSNQLYFKQLYFTLLYFKLDASIEIAGIDMNPISSTSHALQ